MKVALLTFHNAHNYGAVLQAYALKKVIQGLGYSCDIINFNNQYIQEVYLPRRDKTENLFKNMIINLYHLIWLDKAKKNRHKNFETFIKKHLQPTRDEYKNYVDLKTRLPVYDAYICGSDQIWNLSSKEFDEAYFLTFVPEGKKRIAYAPSFGVGTFAEQQKMKIIKYLSHIDYLSIREKSGQELVNNITNRYAELVLDPTLLLDVDKWNVIAKGPRFIRPYILYYHVINKPYVWQYALKLQKQTGFDIVTLNYSLKEPIRRGVRSVYGASPEEFVGLFKHARIICTTSFHGCVFSIIYNKPFFVGLPDNKENTEDRSSRITSLLDILDLNERLISEESKIDRDLLFLDYSRTEQLLIEKRKQSIEWLKKALEE